MGSEPHIICTVTNDLNYDQRMHRICSSLVQQGYQVTLVGRKKPESTLIQEKQFNQIRLNCFFRDGKLFYLEFNIWLLLYLLYERLDGLNPVDLDTIVPCWLAAKWKKIPCIHDAHEYFAEVPEVIHRPFVKHIWEWVARTFIPKMTTCYTVSYSLAEVLEKQYGKRFHVIRNVPWLTKSNLNPVLKGKRTSFILYQGALNKGRGLPQLIESMKFLNMPLYLAGEGDLSQILREQVQSLGLKNKVHFLGQLSPNDLKELTPKAFLGYNVLEEEGLSYYYSLSNKFFDYVHAGVPMLTNNFPEYREINNEYQVACLVDANVDAIVQSIQYLEHNPKVYDAMIENCLKVREIFNWNTEADKLVSLYDQIFDQEAY